MNRRRRPAEGPPRLSRDAAKRAVDAIQGLARLGDAVLGEIDGLAVVGLQQHQADGLAGEFL